MSTEKELLTAGAANVTITIDIEASVERTWQLMIEDVGKWWRSDFLICGDDSLGMQLDPRPGGQLVEKTGDGGYVWGNVLSFLPNKQLSYVAQIVPPWGGPAQSVVQIELSANGDATTLKLTDSLIGHITAELASSLDQGWRQLYGEGGLKSYVESQ